MRKVLIIAYYFPPLGGAGVQRILRFIKYLPLYGWLPTVVSVSNNRYYVKDYTLLNKIQNNIDIIRIPAFEFMNYYYKLKNIGLHKVVSLLDKITAIPDRQIFWYRNVIKKLPGIIDINKFDIVYATFGPASNLLIGKWLATHYKKPLLIDFRDEWANSPQVKSRRLLKIKRPLFKILESNCIKSSKKVVCLNSVMKDNFLKNYPQESPDKFCIIPNGYDEDDFNNSYDNENCIYNKNKLNILYTGSFYGFQKPDTFLNGLELFIKSNSDYKNKIKVYFIGNFNKKELSKKIEKFGLQDIIDIYPYMKHKEVIIHIKRSDLLLLIIGNVPGNEEIFTGKLFEYLAANKPILAIVPKNGVAAQLIKKSNSGFVVDNNDFKDISKVLEEIANLWERGKLVISQIKSEVIKFSASSLTKELVKLFEDVIQTK